MQLISRRILSLLLPAILLACEADKTDDGPSPKSGSAQISTAARIPPGFNGTRAFKDLVGIVNFGPRNPNSPGHRQALTHISAVLKELADSVRIQSFVQRGYGGEILNLSNIIASFNPFTNDRILICTHWDTRPWADRDLNPQNWNKPIPGANDGASGTAVLLELARLMKEFRPPIGVDLVFFDGEDYGVEGDTDNYLLGSRHFARTKPPNYVPRFGILIDMIGDANLEIAKEGYSMEFAPDVVDLVWERARLLGYHQFLDLHIGPITDDHVPLNEAGIRTIDLIDLAYPDATNTYWHTQQDTPDKCSPESLEAVGAVLADIIFTISRR